MATLTGLPGTLNIQVYVGATFSVELTWNTGSPPAPVNLTGYSADMVVKAGQNTVIELSTDNGRISLGGSAGTISLTISATDTTDLLPATADYDLLLTSPGGVVTPLVSGLCIIRKGQTV